MIKLTKDGLTVLVESKVARIYKRKGWEVIEVVTPPPVKSDNFKNLTKAQLQELCKDKGIDYKPRDTKTILINKLDLVNSKTLVEGKASNKEFNDSLIKTR